MIIDEIIDHRRDVNAIGKEDVFTETTNGTKQRKTNTSGWQLCIKWKGGSTNCVEQKDTKQSYPVELADYAKRMKIDDEPMFA